VYLQRREEKRKAMEVRTKCISSALLCLCVERKGKQHSAAGTAIGRRKPHIARFPPSTRIQKNDGVLSALTRRYAVNIKRSKREKCARDEGRRGHRTGVFAGVIGARFDTEQGIMVIIAV